ncbi:pterin-4-alpha-carbinolamine dehydratase [Candidatus Paracaedimonas acanthamoebae]|nr:pterin-4-alpha-carbinolamine dehydratase [Candidatus Paracaedimonas acanthamoebae]
MNEGWAVNEAGHLYREYKFRDFRDAMNFANAIATIAESILHHPLLTITWGLCRVELWTHDADKLTEKDFLLAEKIETI